MSIIDVPEQFEKEISLKGISEIPDNKNALQALKDNQLPYGAALIEDASDDNDEGIQHIIHAIVYQTDGEGSITDKPSDAIFNAAVQNIVALCEKNQITHIVIPQKDNTTFRTFGQKLGDSGIRITVISDPFESLGDATTFLNFTDRAANFIPSDSFAKTVIENQRAHEKIKEFKTAVETNLKNKTPGRERGEALLPSLTVEHAKAQQGNSTANGLTSPESNTHEIDARGDGNCGPRAMIQSILRDGLLQENKDPHIRFLRGLWNHQQETLKQKMIEQAPVERAKLQQNIKESNASLQVDDLTASDRQDMKGNVDAVNKKLEKDLQDVVSFQTKISESTQDTLEAFFMEYQQADQNNTASFIQKYFSYNSSAPEEKDDFPIFTLAGCLRFDIAKHWQPGASDPNAQKEHENLQLLWQDIDGAQRSVFAYFDTHNIYFDISQKQDEQTYSLRTALGDGLRTQEETAPIACKISGSGQHFKTLITQKRNGRQFQKKPNQIVTAQAPPKTDTENKGGFKNPAFESKNHVEKPHVFGESFGVPEWLHQAYPVKRFSDFRYSETRSGNRINLSPVDNVASIISTYPQKNNPKNDNSTFHSANPHIKEPEQARPTPLLRTVFSPPTPPVGLTLPYPQHLYNPPSHNYTAYSQHTEHGSLQNLSTQLQAVQWRRIPATAAEHFRRYAEEHYTAAKWPLQTVLGGHYSEADQSKGLRLPADSYTYRHISQYESSETCFSEMSAGPQTPAPSGDRKWLTVPSPEAGQKTVLRYAPQNPASPPVGIEMKPPKRVGEGQEERETTDFRLLEGEAASTQTQAEAMAHVLWQTSQGHPNAEINISRMAPELQQEILAWFSVFKKIQNSCPQIKVAPDVSLEDSSVQERAAELGNTLGVERVEEIQKFGVSKAPSSTIGTGYVQGRDFGQPSCSQTAAANEGFLQKRNPFMSQRTN